MVVVSAWVSWFGLCLVGLFVLCLVGLFVLCLVRLSSEVEV